MVLFIHNCITFKLKIIPTYIADFMFSQFRKSLVDICILKMIKNLLLLVLYVLPIIIVRFGGGISSNNKERVFSLFLL